MCPDERIFGVTNLPIPLNTKMWPWQHIFTFKQDPNQSHFPPLILVLSPLPSLAPHLLPSLSPLPFPLSPSFPSFPSSVILIIFTISFFFIFPFYVYFFFSVNFYLCC